MARPVVQIVVLNNYDLERTAAEVGRGEKPSHHLYGIDVLRARGWRVEIVPQQGGPGWLRTVEQWLTRLRLPVPRGDLGQQWQAWSMARGASVIYAPCQTQTQTLAYLRAVGLLRTPLVVLAHHPPVTGRLRAIRRWFFRWETRGADRYPALSRGVAREVLAGAGHNQAAGGVYAPVLHWGPDLDYYTRFRVSGPGEGAMGTGRTGRDWFTFGRGATVAGTPARIYCLAHDVKPEFASFGAGVQVVTHQQESDLPYPRLLAELATARVIAVPLAVGPALAGLTSVTDALGLGKPIVVTRHPLLDLDVEKLGIGHWVEPGDVEGWAKALHWFETHPDEAEAMGRRARETAEARWNSRAFARELTALLESVTQ